MMQLENAGIYVLWCRLTGKCYVGKGVRLERRAKQHLSLKEPKCPHIHAAIQEHGAAAFDIKLIPYPGISPEALCEVEKWKIRELDSYYNGYNRTKGGEGFDPETAREISLRRVEDGTHNFLGPESNRRRVEDGTHNLLGSETARQSNRRRVEDGTHHFLGESNPVHKQIADGTHHFLGGEIQRETNRQRVEDGTHHFLGSENNRRRIETGTHNFLSGDLQRGDNSWRRKKRLKAEWMWVRSLALFWFHIHDHIMKRRAEFYNKEIPDTSKAEQTDFLTFLMED